MSMHVCTCSYVGKIEYHIRYPGLTEREAQEIANALNSDAITVWRQMRRLDAIDRMEAAAYHMERAAHYMRPKVSLLGQVNATPHVTP